MTSASELVPTGGEEAGLRARWRRARGTSQVWAAGGESSLKVGVGPRRNGRGSKWGPSAKGLEKSGKPACL